MNAPYNFTDVLEDIRAMQMDRISDARYEEQQAREAFDQAVSDHALGWARYSEVLAKEAQWHDKRAELQQLQSEVL